MIVMRTLLLLTLSSCISSNPILKTETTDNLADSDSEKKVTISNFYITTPGIGRHKFHLVGKTWEEARVICLNEGAHLAVIKSAVEEALLMKHMIENKVNMAFLGFHEQFKKDDWVTVKDQRLDSLPYVHWGEGQPDAAFNNTEHCGSLYIDSKGLNDWDCNKVTAFFCKIE